MDATASATRFRTDEVVETAIGSTLAGRVPVFALTAALGLVIVAVANVAGRQGASWAEGAFWAGLLTVILPIAWRLFGSAASRGERMCLVVIVGIALFTSHVIYSPISVSAFDEFLHLKTANDLIDSGRLFTPNALLPVSPYYPGLENVTSAIVNLSGLPVVDAGFLLLAAARLVFMLSIFLFFDRVSGSARLAGIAALVYMANPRFLYFDAQYSYESLALPLAALVLMLTAWRERAANHSRTLLLLISITIVGVVVSHHITSFIMSAFLILWAFLRLLLRERDTPGPGPAAVAIIALLSIVVWAVFVATPTIGYLTPQVTSAASQIADLMSGGSSGRELFRSAGGDIAPTWERLVGLASTAVLLVSILVGIPAAWFNFRREPVAWALALVALSFPASLVARLTSAGAEVATRTPEFLFYGVGFVAACAATTQRPRFLRFVQRPLLLVGLTAIIFVGGIIVGIPRWQRLPGPYLVSADYRSIEPNGIAAAIWSRRYLGIDNRFIADRVNRLLMGTYGDQAAVTPYLARFDVATFYEAPVFGGREKALIQKQDVELVVVDHRLTTALPVVGFYFQRSELKDDSNDPLPESGLAKFDTTPTINKLFDNGDIQLYDVKTIENENAK